MRDLEELISRMCLAEPGVDSADSKSWHAHREAERLCDPELLEAVKAYLGKKRGKHERKAAYFVLGKLGKNLSSKEAAHSLLQYVPTEMDKYALSTALDMIADLPLKEDEDLSLIANLLLDSRWLVRHAAIRALRSSTFPGAEENLIALLKSTSDDHDKVYCQATLSVIGTERSLPAIQANVASRKRDVKASAEGAIENIQRRVAAHLHPERSPCSR